LPRVGALVLIAAGAVVPWIFWTGLDDVFYLPKLIALWVLLAALLWLLVLGVVKGQIGPRLQLIGLVDGPAAVFILLDLLAMAVSEDRHQSLLGERLQHQGVLTALLYAAFFYLARVLLSDGRRLALFFGAITVGATGVSAYAIVQKLGLDPIWKGYLPSGRVFGTIGQPNALAAYLVLAIPVTAALVLGQKRTLLRLLMLGGLAAMIVALLLTYSRGGYLGLAVAALVFVYGSWERARLSRRAPRAFAGLAVIAIVLTVGLVAPARSVVTGAWHRAWSVSELTSNASIANHLDQWKVAVRIIEAHPLMGTGPETFPEVFPTYSRMVLAPPAVRYFDQFRVESPHDEVLAVASGAGLPTAIAYVTFLGGVTYVLVRGIRRIKDSPARLALVAVLAAGAGHFVTDSFMSAEITGSWLFWTLIGAGVACASSLSSVA
jgi:putative inorganic carbon (HCO3(-)) transporter